MENTVEDAVVHNLPTLFVEISKFIAEAPYSNRVVGFITGMILLIAGLLNSIFDLLSLSIFDGGIDLLIVMIGNYSYLTNLPFTIYNI